MVTLGILFLPAAWALSDHCMVVALRILCLKSIGEFGESNSTWMTFGKKKHLAGIDCLPIAGRSLWEPLKGCSVK